MRRLALAGLLVLAGCGDRIPPLPPMPPPPPTIVEVPTYLRLPLEATSPCERPQARPIKTDVDLLSAADAWRVTAICSENKLRAIESAQPQETP